MSQCTYWRNGSTRYGKSGFINFALEIACPQHNQMTPFRTLLGFVGVNMTWKMGVSYTSLSCMRLSRSTNSYN